MQDTYLIVGKAKYVGINKKLQNEFANKFVSLYNSEGFYVRNRKGEQVLVDKKNWELYIDNWGPDKKEKDSISETFQKFFILFTLYVYTTHIKEDWTVLTKFAKIYYYPFWLIRSLIIWLICPVFIPAYLFKQSKTYQHYKKLETDIQYQSQALKPDIFKFSN